jgi:hypothetical protein
VSGAPEGGSLLSRRGKARRHEHLPQHRRRDCACSRSHARDNSPRFAPVVQRSELFRNTTPLPKQNFWEFIPNLLYTVCKSFFSTSKTVEMNNLEEQADNAKARELFWKPFSWLVATRPTSANDAFDPALWETFVSTTLGLEVPTLAALPRLHNSPLAKCGCKKFCMDFHGDHTSTCTAHSGATKAHDWMVSVLGPLFRTAGHVVRTQHGVTAGQGG